MPQPIIGISADLIDHNGLTRAAAPITYTRAVVRAGGIPVVLPPVPETAVDVLNRCDGLVFTGGDDPVTEPFGYPTDPRVTPVAADRQQAESSMLEHLAAERPDLPVLGVCLGMQIMALHAGGTIDQFMPDSVATHADHWERVHPVRSLDPAHLAEGSVNSKHKQSITDAGHMEIIGVAHDGVCEALRDPDRSFYVGVQWHPERTDYAPLGLDLFRALVRSAQRSAP